MGALGIVSSAALVTFGLLGILIAHQETHQSDVAITATTITHSTDTPSETPPDEACERYSVAIDQPRMIEAPSIGMRGCIQRVGVDQHGAIAVPDNIHLAGWYTESALPGDYGLSILDGHVLGRYTDAIFAYLHTLKAGDILRVQYGDLSWKEFQVTSVDAYTVDEVMPHLLEQVADRQLNLITCAGSYDAQERTYNERLVVRSALVGE